MKPRRQKIFDGRIFKVFKGNKTLPGGREAYFEEVKHPGAALIIPFIGRRIVFIRQYRGVIGKYIWELPAGILEKGETPYACAKREIAEETGYRVGRLKRIGFIYTTPGFCNEKIYIFKAECSYKRESQRDEDEMIKVRKFTRNEIHSLFKEGKIIDSKTIAALAFSDIL